MPIFMHFGIKILIAMAAEKKPFEEMSIGERIRYLREEILGIDKATMAREIGMGWSALHYIEQEKVKVTKQAINRIVKAYSVNPEWLLTGRGEIFIVEDLPEKRNIFTYIRWILKNVPVILRKNRIRITSEDLKEELYLAVHDHFFQKFFNKEMSKEEVEEFIINWAKKRGRWVL